jgi:hypothetical protein
VLCPQLAATDSLGALAGVVRSVATDGPVDGATVSIGWSELVIASTGIRNERRRVPARADAGGRFVACGVPTDVPLEVQAQAPGLASGLVVLQVPIGGLLRRDLRIGDSILVARAAASSPADTAARDAAAAGPATLRGRVVGPDGRPLERAQVRVAGLARVAVTGPAGTFLFDGLPEGSFGVEARAIGFEPVYAVADLHGRAPAEVRLALTRRVQELSSVVVRGRRTYRSSLLAQLAVRQRRNGGVGRLFNADDIGRRNPLVVSDLVQQMPGFRVIPGPSFRNAIVGRGGCEPRVLLDGLPVHDGALELDVIVRPHDLMAIEAYAGLGAPVELTGGWNDCGVVALWTRR